MSRKINLPREELRELYRDKKLTTGQIARHFGVSKDVVRHRLGEYEIKRWSQSEINRRSMLGHKRTKEHRKNLSKSLRGKTWDVLGREMSQETKDKMSKAHRGSKSSAWKGGVTKPNKLARNRARFKNWREAVFKRDDYTCQVCGERGVYLEPHHIKRFADYLGLRYELSNGITLCRECHKPMKLKEEKYEPLLIKILEDRKREEVVVLEKQVGTIIAKGKVAVNTDPANSQSEVFV
jgi:hypothetical protein